MASILPPTAATAAMARPYGRFGRTRSPWDDGEGSGAKQLARAHDKLHMDFVASYASSDMGNQPSHTAPDEPKFESSGLTGMDGWEPFGIDAPPSPILPAQEPDVDALSHLETQSSSDSSAPASPLQRKSSSRAEVEAPSRLGRDAPDMDESPRRLLQQLSRNLSFQMNGTKHSTVADRTYVPRGPGAWAPGTPSVVPAVQRPLAPVTDLLGPAPPTVQEAPLQTPGPEPRVSAAASTYLRKDTTISDEYYDRLYQQVAETRQLMDSIIDRSGLTDKFNLLQSAIEREVQIRLADERRRLDESAQRHKTAVARHSETRPLSRWTVATVILLGILLAVQLGLISLLDAGSAQTRRPTPRMRLPT